jgi:hypothetical protein
VDIAGRMCCSFVSICNSVDPFFIFICSALGLRAAMGFQDADTYFQAGTLTARLVRFPLVVGGLVMAIFALILPVEV